jgi:hypothetical protein
MLLVHISLVVQMKSLTAGNHRLPGGPVGLADTEAGHIEAGRHSPAAVADNPAGHRSLAEVAVHTAAVVRSHPAPGRSFAGRTVGLEAGILHPGCNRSQTCLRS